MDNFRFDSGYICTNEGSLTIGGSYQFKESYYVRDVILKSVSKTDEFWYFHLLIEEEQKTFEVSFNSQYADTVYTGMWRLFEPNTYDVEKSKKYKKHLLDNQDDIIIPKIDFNDN